MMGITLRWASKSVLRRALLALISAILGGACGEDNSLSQSTQSEFNSNRTLGASDKNDGALGAEETEKIAPEWLLSLDNSDVWADAEHEGVLRAWVGARVANTRYDKRVFIEVSSIYPDQREVRLLVPAHYQSRLGSDERWGSDEIELYPYQHEGRELLPNVMVRLRLQTRLDGRDKDEMVVTPWRDLQSRLLTRRELDNPWVSTLTSPVRTTHVELDPHILFAPFEDPGALIIKRIDELRVRKLTHPERRVTLHAAVFNINDDQIIDAVIRAHQSGVEVRLLMDGRKFRPRYHWYRGDDRLLAAGVPLMGARYEGRGAMHNKFILFDGESVATGSMNWEPGARRHNHENMIFSQDHELVSAYARRFEALVGGPLRERVFADDVDRALSVSFAPDEEPHRIAGALIDQAREQILVSMFTAKDVAWSEDGQRTSLLNKLIHAHQRGVEVIVLVDHGIHEASEYYGILTDDDPIDEWLESEGVRVVRVDNTLGRYASMHHKFMVVDQEIAVTGAFNWYYDAAFLNDEDQVVIRSEQTARHFVGEVVHLLSQYDQARFEPAHWPHVKVEFEVEHPHTFYGDQVVITGSLPQLGAWNPHVGLTLRGAPSWPIWRGELSLPLGFRGHYKVVVLGRDGSVTWESRGNRQLQIPVDREVHLLKLTPRFD